MSERMTTRFRRLLEAPELLVLPGVHDALTAKVAQKTGAKAVTMGGFAATGVLIGEPDTSQLSLTELADHYARICNAVEIPVLGDGDTGFGNPTNVRRVVREFERAGLAGLFIEDQIFPKRCGHTPGKDVISIEDMLAKLKAALDAREDPDLVIMARTDALAVHGFEQALERAHLFREAGADLLFVEAPTTAGQMRRICHEVGGLQFANMIDFGMSPDLTVTELQEIGFAAAAWAVGNVFLAARAYAEFAETLLRDGNTRALRDRMLSFDEYMALVGLPQVRDREQANIDYAAELVKRSKK